jgi:hypothetical protein
MGAVRAVFPDRADLDFGAVELGWRVQDQGPDARAEFEHDAA